MNKTKADVLIFGGQSNMVGETEGLPEVNEPVSGAFEYRYMSNELTELKHPVGEDLFNGNLQMSVNGGGSLVPSFCQKYCDITGKSVIVIQAACGSTTISEWLHGTRRHYWADKKIRAGIAKAKERFDVGHIYYVWLQGESDAIIHTLEDDFNG